MTERRQEKLKEDIHNNLTVASHNKEKLCDNIFVICIVSVSSEDTIVAATASESSEKLEQTFIFIITAFGGRPNAEAFFSFKSATLGSENTVDSSAL